MSFVRAILPFLLPVALAAVGGVEERTTCSDVHVFMARGNGEAYPGRVGAIANTVCNGLPSCDAENIQFDSSQAYCTQASDGVSSGLSQIAAYASSCPSAKIVLAGYSLGAQIVGDILGGGGGAYYGCTEGSSSALSTSVGSHVAAVLLFGDVLHVANEPYNVGNGSGNNGQYPRSGSSLANLDVYSSRLQSYCLSTDPICALGDDGLSHTTYMTVYADQAGEWVQQKLGYATASSSSGSSSAASSSTSSATTSTSTVSASSSATTITSSSLVTKSGTTSAVFTTITSSASVSASATTITSSASYSYSYSSSSSSSGTSTIGVATSSVSANSATFTPFDFSDSATVATTSTYIASSPTSTLSFTGTGSGAKTTLSTTSSASHATATSSSSSTLDATPSVVTGAAYSNSAKLSLNLVTLVVIKMLAF